MSHVSILKRSISMTVAGLLFVGLLSPANAGYRHDAVSVFPDLPINAIADHASIVLTCACPGLLRSVIGNRAEPPFPSTRSSRPGSASSSGSTRSWTASWSSAAGADWCALIIPERNNH